MKFWKKSNLDESIKSAIESLQESVLAEAKNSVVAKLNEWFASKGDVPELEKEVKRLKNEIADLKQKKKMEEEDIKHLVKLKQESLEVEHQKKELVLKNEYKDKEMKMQKDYHDQVISHLDTARQEMKEIYTEIMKRLPNVNMDIYKERIDS